MTADTLVDLTDANFTFGTYVPFAPAGAITFPFGFTTGGGTEPAFAQASGLTLSAAPAEGCVRTVNSVTVAFALTSDSVTQGLSPALTFGTPNEFAEDATYDYDGAGVFAPNSSGGVVVLPPSEFEQTGVLTVAYDAPVDYSTALLALGFQNFQSQSADWSITSANFSVNDVCPDAVIPAAPAAAVPVVPVVPTLANTGADLAPLMGTAGALLLAGIAGTAIATVRRRRALR